MTPKRRHTDSKEFKAPERCHRNGPLRRIAVAPFELLVGFLAVWAGLSGLFGWSVPAVVTANMLPAWQLILANVLYAVSGIGIIAAVIYKVPQLEAAGLAVLAASVFVRPIAVLAYLGTGPLFNGLLVNALLVAAFTGVRLWVVLGGRSIMLAEPPRADDPGEAVVSRAI